MKKTVLTLALVFLVAGVSGHQFNLENLEQDTLPHYQQDANIYSEEVPSYLNSLIGDQTINVRIDSPGTEKEVGVKMNGTTVSDLQMGGYPEPTLQINTTEDQISNISTADQPIKVLNNQLKNDEVDYKTRGFMNSLRFSMAKQLLSIASSF